MTKTQQNMRVAMLGHKRIPSREGGIEIVVEELSTRMASLGCSVTCYNRSGHHVAGAEFDKKIAKHYKGVSLRYVFTINRKGLAAMTSSIIGAIQAAFGPYDVVHFHAEGPSFMCWLPKLMGKKVIVTIHGLDWQRAKWGKFASAYIMGGEKAAVKWADGIIVLSKNVKNYFLNTYKRDVVYIPNGVNKPILETADLIFSMRGLKKDSYVLYLGRLVPEKGVKYLIEAWKQVDSVKNLVIAGGSSDTDQYTKELEEMAQDDKRIIFMGFVQGKILNELYSNAYVYCLPSDLEGMPLSLLEAMSYGNCCLTSDIPECLEIIEDKAVSFHKGDINDLHRKLQYLIDNPQLVQMYKSQSSDYICSKYNWDDVVDQTLQLYQTAGQ